ncbi:MAG: Nif3-like dinuclear metal center hexameric protein [Ardenticatenaceae bacterium]|nr:Nif3-like dinuclear metal center hexameric protein [Anaerolineales bacterium]MCB8923435.1 Nif3-like dinuclear metal center hexameric protein [Ardenticatenaceae bacterium]MCB8991410.1 Nif3-like dinuclear metal center hexameric protein [Ardenticatenaceae bacterium]MCB9003840.1 Nif3-like dinuclear metal center hexameric protein [Ardenticatenaceae bacterium]
MEYTKLVAYLNNYLHITEIADYGPQGLQLEADNPRVQRIALAVDVAPPVVNAAAEWGADMLLVHHGILWRDVTRLAGPLGERVRLLLRHNMHLYAAHLPLDAHPEVGNNAVLAQMMGLSIRDWWFAPKGTPLGVFGVLENPMPLAEFVGRVETNLHTKSRVLPHGTSQVQQVAIISGFGADQVAAAKELGADTFLTGETSHANYWAAADHDINVIFAGHYATETVGVQALGQHLAAQFDVQVKFFDFPTNM